jgi:hypothetical protein
MQGAVNAPKNVLTRLAQPSCLLVSIGGFPQNKNAPPGFPAGRFELTEPKFSNY